MTDPVGNRLRLDIAAGAYEVMLSSTGIICIPSAPSENCCYLCHSDYPNRKERLSVKGYPLPSAAIDALYADKVEWGPWRDAGELLRE